MRPEEKDAGLLWDMQEAAKEIAEFVEGVKYDEFEWNKVLRYAVERQLLVLGEVAKGVSSAFKEKHPEIPWGSIVGQRNILAHEYGEILIERIWRVATEKIPELVDLLSPLVPEPPE
ncbi:MAG: HepT-like ribonuclease domain-containing protein [Planctomycetota bacterium]|jgi:uncharacterized protein with HEPN domain